MTINKKIDKKFNEALENVIEDEFNVNDIKRLLDPKDEDEKSKILNTAREIKNKHFSNKVFLYGFIYFSTICKNNCNFCFYRKENDEPKRYRKSKEEILKISKSLAREGVNLLDITSGEDPYYDKNFEKFLNTIREVSNLDVPIMVSPGVKNKEELAKIHQKGADWYALYQETHSKRLYDNLRPNQSYNNRKNARKSANQVGMLVEDGILLGVGETKKDVAKSIFKMSKEELAQLRCMPFVKHKGIPLTKQKHIDYSLVIALLRLTNPKKLIPASLDIKGLKGIKDKLKSGANVITSIIPQEFDLAGVAQHEYGIESGERSPKKVKSFLKNQGFEPATKKDLLNYMNKIK